MALALVLGAGAVLRAQPSGEKPPAAAEKGGTLQEEIQKLRQRLGARVPIAPSECHIKGKLETNHVQLQARFVIVTELPGQRVALGCGRKAQVTHAVLDGKTPLLREEGDSLQVVIEEPARAPLQLTLDLNVPLARREQGLGFELDLPRSAITSLDLELPADVKELRLGETPLEETLLRWKDGKLTGSLGPSERLQVRWKEPSGAMAPGALVTAEARIEARIDPIHRLSLRAGLRLEARGAPVAVWRLLLPRDADLQLAPSDEALLAGPVERSSQGAASLHTLRFKEPRGEPLNVTVAVPPGPPLTRGKLEAVGPFLVLDAVRQTGTLVVYSLASDLQLRLHPRGDTLPREVSAEEEKLGILVRGFKYDRPPLLPGEADAPKSPAEMSSLSLLDVEVERVRGLLETRVSHTLRLVPGAGSAAPEDEAGRWRWEVQTTVRAVVAQPGVETLEVQMPPGCAFVPLPPSSRWPDPIVDAQLDPDRSVVQLKVARGEQKTFSVTLKGRYSQPVGDAGDMALALPRPLETATGTGVAADFQIEVLAPLELELTRPEQGALPLTLARQTPWQLIWQPYTAVDRPVEQIAVGWRRYRPDVRAASTVDLVLTPREAQVRQELRLRFPHLVPERLDLRVPTLVAGRLGILAGGAPVRPAEGSGPAALVAPEEGGGSQVLTVQLTPPAPPGPAADEPDETPEGGGQREVKLVLEYSYLLPEEALLDRSRSAFSVPVVQPVEASLGETRVRIWSEPGLLPSLAGGEWSELPVEEVAGVGRLPVKVLRTQRLAPAISLRLGESGAARTPVWIKHALVRVRVTTEREQIYHASFLISQLLAHAIDLELPVPVRAATLRVTLGGNVLDPETLDENGQRSDSGRIARLHVSPGLAREASLLEVSYHLQPGRAESGALWTTLRPPLFRGAPAPILTRWQISLPSGWVPVWPEEGPGASRVWVREGWLLGSRPAASAEDLERWLLGGAGPSAGEPSPRADAAGTPASLVCWHGLTTSLLVVHVPARPWLLACSLTVLVLGLGLVFWWQRVLRGTGSAFWLCAVLVLLLLAGVAAALIWPTTATAVLVGCQPGAAVLLLAVLLQWLIHERQRRRVLYLPSFSRSAESAAERGRGTTPAPTLAPGGRSSAQGKRMPGSSRPREPSTIDAPGSS